MDLTVDAEIQKKRPCAIVSPDEIHFLKTCIIAPITSTIRQLSTKIPLLLKGLHGEIVLDQIRVIDNSRLLTYIDCLDNKTSDNIITILQEMFVK